MSCLRMNYIGKLAILALAYIAIPYASHADDTKLIKSGQELAQRLCSRCHAIGAKGDSPFSPAPPFRKFSEKWPVEHLEEAFAEGIVVGHPEMPVFELKPPEIGALIAFLSFIQEK